MQKRNLAKLLAFLVPPLILYFFFINELIKEQEFFFDPPSKIVSSRIGSSAANNEVVSNTKLNSDATRNLTSIKNFLNYSEVFNISPDILKHNIFVKNNVVTKLSYSEGSKQRITNKFNSELNCLGEIIFVNKNIKINKEPLQLNGSNIKDRDYVEKVIKECGESVGIGIKNDTGKTLYDPRVEEFLSGSKVSISIRPKIISKIIAFFGFLIFWWGTLILLREGPYKYLKIFLFSKNKLEMKRFTEIYKKLAVEYFSFKIYQGFTYIRTLIFWLFPVLIILDVLNILPLNPPFWTQEIFLSTTKRMIYLLVYIGAFAAAFFTTVIGIIKKKPKPEEVTRIWSNFVKYTIYPFISVLIITLFLLLLKLGLIKNAPFSLWLFFGYLTLNSFYTTIRLAQILIDEAWELGGKSEQIIVE